MRFGTEIDDLNGYISDTEFKKKHKLSFKKQDTEQMFFSIVASYDDKIIESKLISINLLEEAEDTEDSGDKEFEKYINTSYQSSYEDKLFSKILDESEKLRGNIINTIFVIVILMLSILMLTSWSHFLRLFSNAVKRIKHKE